MMSRFGAELRHLPTEEFQSSFNLKKCATPLLMVRSPPKVGVSNHEARTAASSFETPCLSRPKDGVALLACGMAPQDEEEAPHNAVARYLANLRCFC